jgi:hypothetical protein
VSLVFSSALGVDGDGLTRPTATRSFGMETAGADVAEDAFFLSGGGGGFATTEVGRVGEEGSAAGTVMGRSKYALVA